MTLNPTQPKINFYSNIITLKWFTLLADLKFFSAMRTVYFALILGSNTLAGILLSVYTLTAVIVDVPLGLFSDVYGKRKTIILGSICSFVGVACYALGNDLRLLVVGSILEGIAMACFSGNNEAIVYESLELEGKADQFGKEFGKIMSYFQMAMIIASLGSLLSYFSLNWCVWISLIPLLANVVLATRIIEPTKDIVTPKSVNNPNLKQFVVSLLVELKNNPKLLILGLLNSLEYAFAETTYYFRGNFVATLWALPLIGVSKIFSSICGTISFRIADKVISKFGANTTLIYGNVLARIIDILATVLNSTLSPVLIGLSSLTYGTTTITQKTLLQNQLKSEFRASIPSFFSLIGNLIFCLFSIGFGLLSDNYGVFWSFMIFQLGYVGISIGYWLYGSRFESYTT